MSLNLGSGIITRNNKRLPLCWDGEHAEHLAIKHSTEPGIHPFLHQYAQKIAKYGKEAKAKGQKYYRFFEKDGYFEVAVILPKATHVLICTCNRINISNFSYAKKLGIGKTNPSHKKNVLVKPSDIVVNEHVLDAFKASEGYTESDVQFMIAQLVNSSRTKKKKK
ncbi:MAG: hypothetical protein ACOYKE_02515 [Ferruginibacter sp.]